MRACNAGVRAQRERASSSLVAGMLCGAPGGSAEEVEEARGAAARVEESDADCAAGAASPPACGARAQRRVNARSLAAQPQRAARGHKRAS